MMRFSKSLIVMALGLAFCAMAEANGGPGQNGGNRGPRKSTSISSNNNNRSFKLSSSHSHSDYNLKHGTKFEQGYFYKGKYHDHWSHYCWYPSYGCYLYYDPCVYTWYYWCAPA